MGLGPRGPGPGGARARVCDPRPDRALHTLQAGIAACHACARTAGDTDWKRIVALYDGWPS